MFTVFLCIYVETDTEKNPIRGDNVPKISILIRYKYVCETIRKESHKTLTKTIFHIEITTKKGV